MIIFDTNLVSELARPLPSTQVIAWLDELPADQSAITAITVAELRYGVHRLPDGQRKARLGQVIEAIIAVDFRDRVHPFDLQAADQYSDVVIAREGAGQPISVSDAQIAAICRSRGAAVATRNVTDFTGTGIEVINPWEQPPAGQT